LAWKVNWTMAAWGIAFGIAATLTGMFVLAAVEGGFLAEGFFLLVLFWVLLLVLVAKLVARVSRK
jgi:hypothetical protein